MEQNLRNIGTDEEAERIQALYASFHETPMHEAAVAGHIDVAMEIMNLEPSLARKLNQEGLSPLHLAVRNGHEQLASCLIKHDKDLVRVKGKKGETPFHYAILVENNNLNFLTMFLKACPECILDTTTKDETSLHIATKNGRSEALGVLCHVLRKSEYYCEDVVDLKDRNGDTALHIAARNGQHEMLKMLLKCKPDKLATTQAGSTALEIAKANGDAQSISVLRGWSRPCRFAGIDLVSPFLNLYKFHKRIAEKFTKASEVIFHGMDNISTENRNALLVILSLLLTTTYQASISPPGSVVQTDANSSYDDELKTPGKSVMEQVDFLEFYIPTCIVFLVTYFLTLGLLKPFPRGFRTALQVLLAFLAISFNEAVSFIAPTYLTRIIIYIFSALVFMVMLFMCIAYRVSRLGVLILGCWLFPSFLFEPSLIASSGIIVGCWLFLGLYDPFWIGSTLILGGITLIYWYHSILIVDVTVPVVLVILGLYLFWMEVAIAR